MVTGLKYAQTPFQTVWVAGRNASLRRRLERQLANHDHSRVLGWTDRMHEWMAAADLLLSKPGSGTLLEAMNSGLPILAFDPLPGIERRACDLIENWQIGRWIKRPEELAETIDDFFTHPEKLQALRTNALRRVFPGAARLAAQTILGLLPSGAGQLGIASTHQDAQLRLWP
jgi:processive 1,2-diacylglycerol beta-glucosyltransferase